MLACIISTAQQASPKVIHIRLPVRAQVMRESALATRKPLSCISSWSARMGVTPAGSAARSGVEGGAAVADNDPYFRALQDEMQDKGFLVASADSLITWARTRSLMWM